MHETQAGAGQVHQTTQAQRIASRDDEALAALGAAGYLALASGIGTLIGLSGVALPGGVTIAMAGWMTFALFIAWGVLWIWGFLNLIIGSLFGAARLAAGRPIGHLADA